MCSFLSFIIMHNRDTPMNQFTFFNRNILSTLIHSDVYIYCIKNMLSLLAIFRHNEYKCNNYDGYSFSGQKYYRTKKHGLQKRRVFIKNYCHQFIKIIKFCKKIITS